MTSSFLAAWMKDRRSGREPTFHGLEAALLAAVGTAR